MKKIIIILAFLSVCICSEAQKFLRYQMNNDTYNGFYTNCIESIIHDYKDGRATTFVKSSNRTHEILVEDINDIIIEDASITNSDLGEYRIYEFNYEEGDVKKIYVDNRACLFASHKGDFGANDTILYSSAFNEVSWIFFTDGQGRIKRFFDGNRLFYFDYDNDSEFTILDLSTNESKHYSAVKKRKGIKGYRAPSISFFSKIINNEFISFLGDVSLNQLGNNVSNFAQNINNVANNPELHNQYLIVDGLFIAGDIIGIGASILGEAPTLGWSTAGLALSTYSLMNNCTNLINHLWPDSEQMNRYKEYYRNKYSITVKTIDPENVRSNKADLRGTFMSYNGVKGNLYFTISKLANTEMGDKIAGSLVARNSNSYIVKGSATNLKPGTNYFYMLWYECDIDGLHFTYSADNGIDFTTSKPSATTIGTESVNDKTAVVKCSFSNVPEGATCGIQYGYAGNSNIASTSSSDGEKKINLSGLKPSTTYSYRAFIQYEGENYYGETKSFTTKDEELPDLSGTWTFNQSYLEAKSVTMNLVLVQQGSNWATYKASGFYGVITFSMTVDSNRNVSLSLNALNGAHGAFSGTFDEGFTSVSGDSYLYVPDNNNWAVAPWTVNAPWTFCR